MSWSFRWTALAAQGKSTYRYFCLWECLGCRAHWQHLFLRVTAVRIPREHNLPEKCYMVQHESCVQKALTTLSAAGGGSSTVASTSWDWQVPIHSPPGPSPTPAAFSGQCVNYRQCYDLTGGTISWMGEWAKRNGESPLKSKETVSSPHEIHCQREMGGASSILGKCNQWNWPSCRLTLMSTQLTFFC